MNKETIKDALRGAGVGLAFIVWIISVAYLITTVAAAVDEASTEGNYGPLWFILGSIILAVIGTSAFIFAKEGKESREREADRLRREAEHEERMAKLRELRESAKQW